MLGLRPAALAWLLLLSYPAEYSLATHQKAETNG